jgi:hypothetical protein
MTLLKGNKLLGTCLALSLTLGAICCSAVCIWWGSMGGARGDANKWCSCMCVCVLVMANGCSMPVHGMSSLQDECSSSMRSKLLISLDMYKSF